MLSNVFCLANSLLSIIRPNRSDRDQCNVPSHKTAKQFIKLSLGWALCLMSLTLVAQAQIRSGTITGLVTDQKGSVIVGAQVTATNAGTHETSSTTTTQTGLYTMPYLGAGNL
jgi:hypothetical protein